MFEHILIFIYMDLSLLLGAKACGLNKTGPESWEGLLAFGNIELVRGLGFVKHMGRDYEWRTGRVLYIKFQKTLAVQIEAQNKTAEHTVT